MIQESLLELCEFSSQSLFSFFSSFPAISLMILPGSTSDQISGSLMITCQFLLFAELSCKTFLTCHALPNLISFKCMGLEINHIAISFTMSFETSSEKLNFLSSSFLLSRSLLFLLVVVFLPFCLFS